MSMHEARSEGHGAARLQPVGALRPLVGEVRVPGDKSLSHRAVIFSSLAEGTSRIWGISGGEDVERTLTAFQKMGVAVRRPEGPEEPLELVGSGLHGLKEPEDVLECGNSGTTTRLLMGILAGQPFFTALTGDASLRGRPMARVAGYLRSMGASISGRHNGDRLPLAITGGALRGGDFRLKVASAQVKSALMLAGLYAEGETVVTEPVQSRDHTERAFRFYQIPLTQEGLQLTVRTGSSWNGRDVRVPGDISAAAFFLVAASIVPGSELLLKDIGVNPTRTGVIDALRMMGADLTLEHLRDEGPEPVADIRVRAARLHGASLGGDLIPRLIDEIPVLAVAASQAEGRTVFSDAAELRVKESDRIRSMATELQRAGIQVEERPDGMILNGRQSGHGGCTFQCYGDHRIAMSMAVLASLLPEPCAIADAACVDTSFPGFFPLLERAQAGGVAV